MKKIIWKKIAVAAMLPCLVLTSAGCSMKLSNNENINNGNVNEEDESTYGNYEIRVACENSETYPSTLGLQVMKEYVEKQSDGHITLNIYSSGQLGGEEETLEQVSQGSLEMAVASFAPVVTYDPEFEVLDIPFVYNSYEEAWMVLDSHVGTDLLNSLEDYGMVGLAFMENGFRQVTSNKGAIQTVDDFKGLKIRTMQNNNHIKFFQAMGANPTPVAFSELYMALQQHTVDAQENPIANITDKKLYEVQDYLSMTNHIYDAMPLVCNLDYFHSLPGKYQGIIRTGAVLGMEYSRFCNEEREQHILDQLSDLGMKVNTVEDSARQAMAEVAQPAAEQSIAKDIGQEKVDSYLADVKAVLDQITDY